MSLTPATSLRRLLLASIVAGAASGFVLFLAQHLLMGPLIQQAEAYEERAPHAEHAGHAAAPEWEPANGVERTTYTAIGTMLTGIAFGAIVLGVATLIGMTLDLRRGLLLGLAGFVCFVLAPSLGLPPKPPGVAGAEVHAAQLWWSFTVILTGLGLWLLFHARASWMTRGLCLLLVAVPHLLGAPHQASTMVVPAALARHFAWLSVATRLPFWLLLGALGGALLRDDDTALPLASDLARR